jgi:hypothetical protein
MKGKERGEEDRGLTDGIEGELRDAGLHRDWLMKLQAPSVDELARAAGEQGHQGTDLLVLERRVHGPI